MPKEMITIDFETKRIVPRPEYPPTPVGVSIKIGNGKTEYYGWAHPCENNSTFDYVHAKLRGIWEQARRGDCELLFHNSKFDIDVAEHAFGCPRLDWRCYHDTLFLVYLDDPRATTFSLKPSAERILGLKPTERDAVRDWLMDNYRLPDGKKLSDAAKSKNAWGGYISEAPGKLVGQYAKGDVDRTIKLYNHLKKSIDRRGMGPAYNTERELMLYLLDQEKQGIRVDVPRLSKDIDQYTKIITTIEARMSKMLGEINFDSDAELAKAMIDKGLVDKDLLTLTKTGKYSMSKDSLAAAADPRWSELLKYRTQMLTCLRTFMMPWYSVAKDTGGLIYTNWNQVRNTVGGGVVGTSTGRMSSTPNMQNIPNPFEIELGSIAKFIRVKDLPNLPLVRGYVVPWDKTEVLLDRDYSQQELRILAHIEDGKLLENYQENPWLDVHTFAQEMINQMTGKEFGRKPIKNTGFGLIYGMGIKKMAAKSGIDEDLAREVRSAYLSTFPGIRDLYKEMAARAMEGKPVYTWNGREYYCEPPKMVNGRMQSFDYKLLNVIVQGSAADCTKRAVINIMKVKPETLKLYFVIHDQTTMSSPKSALKKNMELMREAMESVKFDVPMLSEGTISVKDWAHNEAYDKQGKIIWKK